MKVQYKASKRITIEVEGDNVKDIHKALAAGIESFGVEECGVCKGDVYPISREVDGNTHFEWVCRNRKCRARLAMGQPKAGGLHPRIKYHKQHPDVKAKKAEEGSYLPDNGWEIYKGQRNDAE